MYYGYFLFLYEEPYEKRYCIKLSMFLIYKSINKSVSKIYRETNSKKNILQMSSPYLLCKLFIFKLL